MDRPVQVVVVGFVVDDPSLDPVELKEAAHEIRSEIGMALSRLGASCQHGGVSITVGGVEANTDDDE